MIRKIIALGKYSGVVAIPRELLRKLKWRKGQKVEFEARRKSLVIKDYKNSST